MQRNLSISIAKAFAIILMVIGHTEYPGVLTSCIYTFHMPLFFITAGYFFTRQTASEPWLFCTKRFKGLYIPMVKWSLMWLLLHNLFHYFGILNETFGNWENGVTHPYTLEQMGRRALLIVTSMSGYDEFMAGAFWFFRGLLVASIVFLVLFRLIDGKGERMQDWHVAGVVMLIALAFMALHIWLRFKLYIPNGGWRETWGVFFFGLGVMYRRWEPTIGARWFVALICAVVIYVAGTLHWSGMNNNAHYRDLLTLPITGVAGFLMVHYVSKLIARREGWFRRLMVFIGDNTLYILVFHIISYKVVSLIKIAYYGLDWRQIGCHMVIHEHRDDMFWVLYSIAGVALPLLGVTAYRKLRRLF